MFNIRLTSRVCCPPAEKNDVITKDALNGWWGKPLTCCFNCAVQKRSYQLGFFSVFNLPFTSLLRSERLHQYKLNFRKMAESGRLTAVDVSDGRSVPTAGRGDIGFFGWILTGLSYLLVICTFPFSLCVCFKVVQEYERAIIFRLGRLISGSNAKGPGLFFILPCIETFVKVDLRTAVFDIPPQEILTRDSVTVSVDAVVYFRISDPTACVNNVENANTATRLLAQTTLRNILGIKALHEILTDRENIATWMQNVLDKATDSWGVKVERVEIKDVRLPLQLQRAMAAEAEASREARAKVIAAEGELKASEALKEASLVMAQSPTALQLRYLQTLSDISAEKNSTIIFPLPIDLLTQFMKPSNAGAH